LPRYLAEWDFKWNTRNLSDGERAAEALKGAEANVSRITILTEPKTIKQKANRFLR
jgi:hypothetical protein